MDSDHVSCNICRKGCHLECLKLSKKRFNELGKHEGNMFVCSNKCRCSFLPFQSLTNTVYINTILGKQKSPCKVCFRECKKMNKFLKCTVCKRTQHTYCIPKLANPHTDSYVCSNTCEIRLMPFNKISNSDMLDEFHTTTVQTPVDVVSNTDIPTDPSIVLDVNRTVVDNVNNIPNIVDTFSHVYCEYINVNEVSNILSKGDPKDLSVFHGNAISLKKNLHIVEDIFKDCSKHPPSIIAISETGLKCDSNTKSKVDDSTVSIKGYNIERTDTYTEKGGVAFYINDDLDYEIRNDFKLKIDFCEDLWVEIKPKMKGNSQKAKNESFFVGVIYRHPNTPYLPFSSRIFQLIQKLNKEKKRFMIVGDININYLNYNLTRKITDYFNGVKSSGCNIHCNLPTRGGGSAFI